MSPSIVAFTEFSWMPRFWATAAMPAVRQLAEPDQHELHRRRPVILGREDLGMVRVERVRRAVALLGAETEEALDGALAVRAVLPLGAGPPRELRALGRLGERVARIEQCLDIDAVVDRRFLCRHRSSGGSSLLAFAPLRPAAPQITARGPVEAGWAHARLLYAERLDSLREHRDSFRPMVPTLVSYPSRTDA